MRYFLGILTGFILSATLAWGANLSSPPPLQDKETYLYLREIWNNLFNLPIVTSNPDGSVRGKRGDILFLDTNGDTDGPEYLEVCTSVGIEGGTRWRGVALTDVP